ncbi:acyl-CoA dehydrogenase family protein [Aeromicrobium sp. CTD01-1L150]|uniref:acyl-CoA dehydrogenase family protein n=1 Tax=Aeromicrobium sp. CTD01-1L150 TaxID=3341830 RepID=UPI0035C1CCB6
MTGGGAGPRTAQGPGGDAGPRAAEGTTLVPTPEHVELANSVRSLLAKHSDSRAVRRALEQPHGFDVDLWAMLCHQIGAPALPIRQEHGGAGFTLAEAHVILEELGHALAPSPLLSSLVATAAADDESLPRIAEGAVATLAWSGVTGPTDSPIGVTWSGDVLCGTIDPVLVGDVADIVLVAARHGARGEDVGLFRVDPSERGLTRTRCSGMDPTLGFATLELDSVPATPITLDAADVLTAAHRVGTLATAALQVGCAQRGLDMTVAYTKEREQFGRPIGSFQALKHRMSDMLVRVRMSRSGAWAAVQAHVHDAPDADVLVAAASSYCSEAAMAVAAETIQMHGGIAITWEHDAHLVLKRAQALQQLFGRPQDHRSALIS